ncbi:MAG: cation:proton antiporter [Prevotella sp.]|nr:cation:proton antiporter [Bacteroides sp.]MCM1366470.1 cation:proton antiporter [Prevotella sp.]MCM1437050.1 cation:proton antiporter [Prevotella sp.]
MTRTSKIRGTAAIALPLSASFTVLPQESVNDVTKTVASEINPSSADDVSHKDEARINGLIGDLAWILLLGALVTLLFKKLRQPVVLGYILAGFLASPKFVYLPSISNLDNIDFWAQLGIVVLMFTLGLEFSFKKLMNSGSTAAVTALIIITGMTFAGFGVGKLLHLDFINCIFLGGMISMSSTTIILKALTDLGLRQKKFASLVLAVLIIEDLFAVLMLVLLSSMAVGDVSGSELLFTVGKLIFFLIIWFVVGVYLLPSWLSKSQSYLNSETLLIVSMGLCFAMSVFSVMCGFSLELGAFVMGSVLAGTMLAERMEKVVQPVKDLFGAVFFISVGMMVEPGIIAQYWWEILLLAGVVIIGMIIFGSIGMLISGQSLKVAIESGFSLTQIGEFSFIIASLGMSLGVLNPSLYPIIVAVSVITIFTTPYFIKLATPAYSFVEAHLPRSLNFLIDRYSKQSSDNTETRKLWKVVIIRYVWRIVLYGAILVAIIILSRQILFPLMMSIFHNWGKLLATVVTLLAMSPFLVALSFSATKPDEKMQLHSTASFYDVPLLGMRIIRYIVTLLFIVYFVTLVYGGTIGWIIGLVCFLLILFVASRKLKSSYLEMEQRFMDNLNIRENTRLGLNNNLVNDLHQAFVQVGSNSSFVGDRLRDAGLRKDYGVSISSIQRGQHLLPLPSSDTRIFPGDVLGVIGTDEQIKQFNDDLERDERLQATLPVTQPDVELRSIRLTKNSPIINVPLGETRIREDYYSMIVKVERADGEFITPTPDTMLRAGDTVWVVGDISQFDKMK